MKNWVILAFHTGIMISLLLKEVSEVPELTGAYATK